MTREACDADRESIANIEPARRLDLLDALGDVQAALTITAARSRSPERSGRHRCDCGSAPGEWSDVQAHVSSGVSPALQVTGRRHLADAPGRVETCGECRCRSQGERPRAPRGSKWASIAQVLSCPWMARRRASPTAPRARPSSPPADRDHGDLDEVLHEDVAPARSGRAVAPVTGAPRELGEQMPTVLIRQTARKANATRKECGYLVTTPSTFGH